MPIASKQSPRTAATQTAEILSGVNTNDIHALLDYLACATLLNRPGLPSDHLACRIAFGPEPQLTGAKVSSDPDDMEFVAAFGTHDDWDCVLASWDEAEQKIFIEWGSNSSHRSVDLELKPIPLHDMPEAFNILNSGEWEALAVSASEGYGRLKHASGFFDHPGYQSALTEMAEGRDLHSLIMEGCHNLAEYAAFVGRLINDCADRDAVFQQGVVSLQSKGFERDVLKQLLMRDLVWVGQNCPEPSSLGEPAPNQAMTALSHHALATAGFTPLETAWTLLKQSTVLGKPVESLPDAIFACADAGETMESLLTSPHLKLVCERPGVKLDYQAIQAKTRSRLLSTRLEHRGDAPAPNTLRRSL